MTGTLHSNENKIQQLDEESFSLFCDEELPPTQPYDSSPFMYQPQDDYCRCVRFDGGAYFSEQRACLVCAACGNDVWSPFS